MFEEKFEMTESQTEKLNSLLPSNLQQKVFEKNILQVNIKLLTSIGPRDIS